MGIDYTFYGAFVMELKPKSVSKAELETFLEDNHDYCWDTTRKLLYLRNTYKSYWNDRLSIYLRIEKEETYTEWAEDDVDYFIGVEGEEKEGGEEITPDISTAVKAFGDRLEVIGWAKVGYTC